MSTDTSAKRLPSRITAILGIISVVLGVFASQYLEAGPVVAVAVTAVLLLVLGFTYNFVSP